MSDFITGKLPTTPKMDSVHHIPQSVCNIHWSEPIEPKTNSLETSHRVSDLMTVQLPNAPKINSVKYLVKSH